MCAREERAREREGERERERERRITLDNWLLSLINLEYIWYYFKLKSTGWIKNLIKIWNMT